VVEFKETKIVLHNSEASMNPTSEELARIIVTRMGLEPRKAGSTDKMFRALVELYERAKTSNRDKKPEAAVITVEEMAAFAGISRQTMYDYLGRWLDLDLIVKTSYIVDNSVVIGYKLNGLTLESAYEKAKQRIVTNLDLTAMYIRELQKLIKNEKISQAQRQRNGSEPSGEEESDKVEPVELPPITVSKDEQENLITA
jgi:hypothetical protein